ncbi:MAG: hypothetical protein M1814_001604 [Vezdaea aestivalis]|nr:MAG: hypothetical protein M1814_001604 [Vezdaea aestivalis]
MDFAPYQSSPPAAIRALSPPPPQTSRRPFSPTRSGRPTSPPSSPPQRPLDSSGFTPLNPESYQYRIDDGNAEESEGRDGRVDGSGAGQGTSNLSLYRTSLGLDLRVESCLAYLLLPPAGGVLLLLFERESDYVRFHAWQSALVFSVMFVIHLIFSWQPVLSWMLFVVNLGLIFGLASRAWRDAETLDRFELPFFGNLASNILDDE